MKFIQIPLPLLKVFLVLLKQAQLHTTARDRKTVNEGFAAVDVVRRSRRKAH